MTEYGLPLLATIALWWASTGAIFYVDSLPRRTFIWTFAGATVLALFALWGLLATAGQTTPGAAYGAFSYGLIIWGWQIVSYYTGFITGPRKTACPPETRGLARFIEAIRTSLYHELAALTGAVLLLALTAGKPNQLGVWTYIVLWWMHESAKLNVFFGVPNLGEEMLPEHLRYLQSFMTRRPMNMFFPFSVTISTVVTAMLVQRAVSAGNAQSETIGYTMLATLMALAVMEHWFLVAPMNGNALWGTASRRNGAELAAELELEFAALAALEDSPPDAQAPESWSVVLPPICDARTLAHVLELVAAGAFGEVDTVKGAVRTPAHWIAFEIKGRKARILPFAPQLLVAPLAVATGRRIDRGRLQAALAQCAA